MHFIYIPCSQCARIDADLGVAPAHKTRYIQLSDLCITMTIYSLLTIEMNMHNSLTNHGKNLCSTHPIVKMFSREIAYLEVSYSIYSSVAPYCNLDTITAAHILKQSQESFTVMLILTTKIKK
jgi:hypothetical protein